MSFVNLVIQAKDQASAVVQKISSAITSLNNASASPKLGGVVGTATAAANATSSLVGQIRAGVLQANLLGSAFNSVIGIAERAAGVIQDGIGKSMELQLSNLSTASGFAAQTGLTFEQSGEFIDKLNEKLSISAAALPGNTAGYSSLARSISDNVIPAFKNLDGSIDINGLGANLAAISESYGALAAGKGVDVSYAAMGLSKALGGGSLSEMMQGLFFEQSPELMNFFEQKLKERGAESFGDIDIKDRVALIKEAGEKFITNEFKSAATMSVSGLMEGFKSTFFDPMTGIFGLSRDLDKKTAGIQSAFKSFNEVLSETIGPEGLFMQFGKTLEAAGILLPDPMRLLKDGLDMVTRGLKFVNGILRRAEVFVTAEFSIADTLARLPKWLKLRELSTAFGKGVNQVFSSIEDQIFTVLPMVTKAIDQAIPVLQSLVSKGVTMLQSLLARIDFGKIAGILSDGTEYLLRSLGKSASNLLNGTGRGLAILLNQGIQSVLSFAQGVNWQQLGYAAGDMLGKLGGSLLVEAVRFLNNTDWGQLFITIGTVALGAIDFLLSALRGAFFSLVPYLETIAAELVPVLAANLETFFLGVRQTGVDLWNAISTAVGEGLQAFCNMVVNLASSVIDLLSQLFQNYVRNIVADLSSIPVLGGMVQNLVSAVVPPAGAAPIPSTLTSGGGRWMGNIPDRVPYAAQGLLAAATEESRRMPQGAQVVVANDREFILKPTGRTASPGGGNTFYITISGLTDPVAIVDRLVDELQSRFEAEQETQLA